MSDPDPKRHDRAMEIFDHACELPREQLAAYLEEACGDDAAMRRQIEQMMDCDAGESGIADVAAQGAALQALADDIAAHGQDVAWEAPLPERIGAYCVVRKLGEGGMGIVYLAEQDSPRRNVAVKVIRHRMASHAMVRRFEFEAGLLGRLHHPGIAQVYEAGLAETADGPLPFIAMELVDGRPLTEYARVKGFGVAQRIVLLASVADAVQHAHQRGVIHRDLKPANILVVDEDESGSASSGTYTPWLIGRCKVLDFGVARALDPDLRITTLQTSAGQIIGTLPYMSPEQVGGDPDEIDTRTDVYALGVILYELLVDRLPFELARLPLTEAARVIREEPPRPIGTLNTELRGDVQTIVNKALEKSKDRRYASAADLAADLRRYLNHEPIVARPASAMYQLRKFAQRNKALVAGVAMTFVVLVAALIAINFARLEAERQREAAVFAGLETELARAAEAVQRADAERQARIARAVNDFLNHDLLSKASPGQEPDRNIPLRVVLDRAAHRIPGRFDEPVVEAEVRFTIGLTYRALGEYEPAAEHLEQALRLRRAEYGFDHRETLAAMSALGELYAWMSRLSEAEAMLSEAVDLSRRRFPDDYELQLDAMNALGYLYQMQSRFHEAEALYAEAMATHSPALGEEHIETLAAMNGLAMVYDTLGRLDEAASLYRRILDITLRQFGEEHPETVLIVQSNLAALYLQQGNAAEAEPLLEGVLNAGLRVYGEDHPEVVVALSNLVVLRMIQERFGEAEALTHRVIDTSSRVLGPESLETLTSLNNLGTLHVRQGKFVEAEEVYRRNLETCRAVLGEDHFQTVVAMAGLAHAWVELDTQMDEAERMLLLAHAWLTENVGTRSRPAIRAVEAIASLYEKRGDAAAAAHWAASEGRP